MSEHATTIPFNAMLGISINQDNVRLTISDDDAACQFVQLLIPHKEFTQILGGLHGLRVEGIACGLERVGKVLQCKELKVGPLNFRDKEEAEAAAIEKCPEGWTPSLYFGCQGSFTRDERGNYWGHTRALRWIDKDSPEGQEILKDRARE